MHTRFTDREVARKGQEHLARERERCAYFLLTLTSLVDFQSAFDDVLLQVRAVVSRVAMCCR